MLAVSTSYSTLEEIGAAHYLKFMRERMELCTVSINAPITRNNVNLFSRLLKVVAPKDTMTIANLKQDTNLLCRALTANSDREVDFLEVFSHENRNVPPSLGTDDRNIREGTVPEYPNPVQYLRVQYLRGVQLQRGVVPEGCSVNIKHMTRKIAPLLESDNPESV